jgi:hypothetical protein
MLSLNVSENSCESIRGFRGIMYTDHPRTKGAINMSAILEQSKLFFEACETGKGWGVCQAYCHPGATFSAQAAALSEIDTLEDYTEWMKNLLTPIPDGHYELRFFSLDEERQCVAAYAVFHGTQTGPGGPTEPTGNAIAADYVYAMQFEGNLIRHMTKIWNDTISLQQLGWA